MSWETMSDKINPCACGKGKVREIFRMDDWNNTESRAIYTCKECYEKALKHKEARNSVGNPAKHDDTDYYFREKL